VSTHLSPSRQRLIQNEERLRRANELVDAGRADEPRGRKEPFLCECSNDDCTATLELHWDEYLEIRKHENRFVIRPDHETVGLDTLVERHAGYLVVDKPA
jgi:hypothetical protein